MRGMILSTSHRHSTIRLRIDGHTSLLLGLTLTVLGCVLLVAPLFGASNDVRLLAAGAAFGGGLTEFLNDFHRAEDRRKQLAVEKDAMQRRDELQKQYETLQSDNAWFVKRWSDIPDLHPRENALRLGSCFAQIALTNKLRVVNHVYLADVRAKARMLGVAGNYDRAVRATSQDSRALSRDQWQQLLRDTRTYLRRVQGIGVDEAFTLGFNTEKAIIGWRESQPLDGASLLRQLQEAVETFSLGEPFRSWALNNAAAAFGRTAVTENSQKVLEILISMLSLSYHLGDATRPTSMGNYPGNIGPADDSIAQDARSARDRRNRIHVSALIRSKFEDVVIRFPNMQELDAAQIARSLVPESSAPSDNLFF